MEKIKITKNKNISALAYMSYVFQTFFKRPFGYIMPILYIVYLAVILLIVPKFNNMAPLAIWTIGGFNIPIFNLLFISATASTIAVSIFRTGRDDGSDLIFSSKPLTKKHTSWIKTIVYLTIMLGIAILCIFITLLIWPIFGKYDIISNPHGITTREYSGIILSVFVGNIVNMLFFGSIAVFISMFGAQVITMVATIGSALLLCILNFLYPISVSSPTNVLSEQYNTSINSYSLYTRDQYGLQKSDPKSFATIQCVTNDIGEEDPRYHFDTFKYWNIAKQKAHSDSTNYIDFGKQLSSIYTAFGLDNAALSEASKLSIGLNNSYKYDIKEHSGVWEHITDNKYPVAVYSLKQERGKTFPKVTVLGGNMSIDGDNWYLWSNLNQINFNSISFLSVDKKGDHPGGIEERVWKATNNKPWMQMSDLTLSDNQQFFIRDVIYSDVLNRIQGEDKDDWSLALTNSVKNNGAGVLFDESLSFTDLPFVEQYNIISKVHLYLSFVAQDNQRQAIEKFCIDNKIEDTFPFTSKTINAFCLSISDESEWNKTQQNFVEYVFKNGFAITTQGDIMYDRLITSMISYAETYSNLYEYEVKPFYTIWALIAAWSTIAICMFTVSIIVYRKIDFK